MTSQEVERENAQRDLRFTMKNCENLLALLVRVRAKLTGALSSCDNHRPVPDLAALDRCPKILESDSWPYGKWDEADIEKAPELERLKTALVCWKAAGDALTQDLCYIAGSLRQRHLLCDIDDLEFEQWAVKHHAWDTDRVTRRYREAFLSDPDLLNAADGLAEICIREAEAVHPVSPWHKTWFHDLARKVATETAPECRRLKEEKESVTARENRRLELLAALSPEDKEILGLKG